MPELKGGITYSECSIVIDPDQPMDRLRETVLHEILHGVLHLAGYGNAEADHELYEQLVSRIAPVLLDTLRRSPNAVRFMLAP